jgi:uncharacterized protein (DUF58 family)
MLIGKKRQDGNVKAGACLKLNTWFLPILVALLLVLQLVAPYRGWIVLLIVLGGVLLTSYLWDRSLARGLQITRQMRFGWAQVGDLLEERFELSNHTWVPAPMIELIDHSTMPGYQAGRGTGVGGSSEVKWRKQATCTRRGVYALGPTTLVAGDPFGIFTLSLHNPASFPFVVMPPVVPLPGIEVSPGGRAGEGRPRADAPDRAVSAASVREYTPGDSLRWIHWRTSARRDSLYVHLFDGTPAGDWWILLDLDRRVQAGTEEDSTEEHGVILAASLADRGLRLGRAVGLVAHGQDLLWLPPQRGDTRRWEILRELAAVSPGTCSLADLLARTGAAVEQYASLVVITPAVDQDWVVALMPLLERGIAPTILLLDPISFGGSGDVRGVAALLSDLEVAHYIITQDLLDRAQPRPKPDHYDWWVLGTGRVLPKHALPNVAWRELS